MNPEKILISLIVFLLISCATVAQELQSDFFTGHNRTTLTSVFTQPIDPVQKFSYSGLAFFYQYYREDDSTLDEAGVQGGVYMNLVKNVSVGTALYYNSIGGFQKKISFLYTKPDDRFSITLVPSLVHVEGQIMGEMIAQLSYVKPVSDQWFFLGQLQVLSSWLTFS